MKIILCLVVGILLTLHSMSAKADNLLTNELKLRDQLFSDVFLVREGVDNLLISVEVLTKRYNNQLDILKSLKSKLISDDPEDRNGVCDKISGMFNATLRKYNVLENRFVSKLQELQVEQTTRLDEIMVKQALNTNCGSQGGSPAAISSIATKLAEVSEKIDKFGETFKKLDALDATKLNLEQTKFDDFLEKQSKVVQEINEKLARNQEQYEKLGKEITELKDLKTAANNVMPIPRSKLPMEVILGLTSSNITSLK